MSGTFYVGDLVTLLGSIPQVTDENGVHVIPSRKGTITSLEDGMYVDNVKVEDGVVVYKWDAATTIGSKLVLIPVDEDTNE